MACFHPVTAYRSLIVNASGKRSLCFDPHKSLPGSELTIPCGKCKGCRVDRSQQWGTRLMHEKTYHRASCSLLITYDDEHLPEHGTLVPKHGKKFMKALNDKFGPALREEFGQGVRYFYCGEYGDSTGRPHYHVILFGVDFSEDRKPWKKTKGGHQLFRSETANRLWGKGNIDIGNVTHESCEYAARYVLKKVNGERAIEHYSRIDPATGEWYLLQPEFIRMSNRPGIGSRFFDDPANANMYARGGFPRRKSKNLKSIPKYYDRKLEKIDPERLQAIKEQRKALALLRKAENSPERLAVREEVLEAKIKLLKREV
ncbi:hypothetical protein D3C85_715470 [compost metagenome]